MHVRSLHIFNLKNTESNWPYYKKQQMHDYHVMTITTVNHPWQQTVSFRSIDTKDISTL